MKLKNEHKKIIYIVSLLLVIGVNVVLLKFPDKIGYTHSLETIETNKVESERLNAQMLSNERDIKTSLDELASYTKEKDSLSITAEKMRSQIDERTFKLHIPSLLIDLEANSITSNIHLVIGYNNIIESDGLGNIEEYEETTEEDKDNKDKDDNEDKNEDKSKEEKPEEKPEEKKEDKANDDKQELIATGSSGDISISSEEIRQQMPNIEGITVTSIPLTIKGKYSNVRKYIKYLDTIEMLEPSVVKIVSNGNDVETSIIINVFHGEVE